MRFFTIFLVMLIGPVCQLAAQERCLADWMARRNQNRVVPARTPLQTINPGIVARGLQIIPVVVHVVYKGNLENISNAQIISQIDVLNEDFRMLNADANSVPGEFAPLAADMELQFCLATVDPDGNPGTGITRTSTNYSNIGQQYTADGTPRIFYTALGGADAWDPEQYLNIWVAGIGDGVLGFSSYPGSAPPTEDGIVVDPRYFGRVGLSSFYPPNDKGRTATHEIGHYFNLRHIWGDNISSCNDDDDVADTPYQRDPYLGCPSFPQMSCGNKAMTMNFMDYTDDACMYLFTFGQKDRIQQAIQEFRPGLISSQGCNTSSIAETAGSGELTIYPNPAHDEVQVSVPALVQDGHWKMFDARGRSLQISPKKTGENVIHFNLQGLPAGVYWLQVQQAQRQFRAKLIKW